MLENGIDRIDWISAAGTLLAMNNIGREALGFGTGVDGVGRLWSTLWSRELQPLAERQLALAASGAPARFTASCDGPGGRLWWDVVLSRRASGDIVAQARDVTAATTRAEDDSFRARRDGLTGLLNRSAIKDQIEIEVGRCIAAGSTGALLMLDLDNFKLINDTLGHDAGDAVLKAVATRLGEVIGAGASAARLGGDEFAVVLPEAPDLDSIREIAEVILDRLRQPIDFNGRMLSARASVGVALFPKHGRSPAELLKHADIALYAAKAFGRGGYVLFVPSMGGPIRRRAAAVGMVRQALADNRVEAAYEPMVELRTGKLFGFEAKLKVRRPDGVAASAIEVAPVYDDIELASELGTRMLARVTEDARTWRNAGLNIGRIAINAAAAEFRNGDYAERFLAHIGRLGLPPPLFDVEVAETVFAGSRTDYVAAALVTLSKAGVRVSLDAFGTGPASLSHLKRLPIAGIKIDGSFVEAVESDSGDSAIVRAMIGLANGFGIDLAADGVTTLGQAQTLAAFGCEVGQGGLFGPAAPATAMADMLAAVRTGFQPATARLGTR